MAVVLVVALLLLCGVVAAGLGINGTHSFPVGFYCASRKRPEKGDLVLVDPPGLPIFALAKARGYLGAGYSAAGCGYLIKCLAGVAGDRVTIDLAGVEVNCGKNAFLISDELRTDARREATLCILSVLIALGVGFAALDYGSPATTRVVLPWALQTGYNAFVIREAQRTGHPRNAKGAIRTAP